MPISTAIAHTNIALIKYWGKKDAQLILPYSNSLSLTLDQFYTQTSAQPAQEDSFILDGQVQHGPALAKVSQFLDLIRDHLNTSQKLAITSQNHVPTAAGLASSASGLAALTLSATSALGATLPRKELSRLARRGSGSACRSIYGGFVEWQKGSDDATSYAVPLDVHEAVHLDIAIIALVVSKRPKKIASRAGMASTVATSPFYPAFVKSNAVDLKAMKKAIVAKDLAAIGQIAEANALKMHATNLGAQPPFSYFLPETLQAIEAIHELRAKGFLCYFTMDAGPNLKLICAGSDSEALMQALQAKLPEVTMILAKPGPGAHLVS